MNLLVDDLPDAVEIDGVPVPISTGFRPCLRVIMAYEDDTLTALEKQSVLLQNLYQPVPTNIPKAIEMALKFLNGGAAAGEREDRDEPRVYSFSHDANLIFAAFRQTHGIDLETADLHWWKFLALFMDLGADTAFCSLVGFRRRVKTGHATKEELKMYREMQDQVDLPEPDNRTLEEREQEERFLRLVEEGRKKRRQTNGSV